MASLFYGHAQAALMLLANAGIQAGRDSAAGRNIFSQIGILIIGRTPPGAEPARLI